MSFHFKADGSLDMRFSTSKAWVASGGSIWGPCDSYCDDDLGGYYSDIRDYYNDNDLGGVFTYNSYSDLHYKSDGTLDMRYNSSKEVMNQISNASNSTTENADLHYKSDGTLDMRYNSSKEAVSNGLISSPTTSTADAPVSLPKPIHIKADGTPDMRFSENRANLVSSDGTHLNVDGSVDKRWKSVKNEIDIQPTYVNMGSMSNDSGEEKVAICVQPVEKQKYIIEIVSTEILNAISSYIPDQNIDENQVYAAYNSKDNQKIVYEEEARKMEKNDDTLFHAILSTDLKLKKLSNEASQYAREVINTIIKCNFPEIIKMQAKLLFSFLSDESGLQIYKN